MVVKCVSKGIMIAARIANFEYCTSHLHIFGVKSLIAVVSAYTDKQN